MARVIPLSDGSEEDTSKEPKSSDSKRPVSVKKKKVVIQPASPEVAEQKPDDLTLEEVNETLKSMAPNLDGSEIQPIKAEPEADELQLDGPEGALDNDELDELLSDKPPVEEAEIPIPDDDALETQAESDDVQAEAVQAADEAEPAAVAEPESAEEDGLPDDPETRKAVDEIVAEEADVVLAAEDMDRELTAEAEEPKPRNLFLRIFGSARNRWLIFGTLTLLLIAAGIYPGSRYFVLNTAGVRASLSIRVVDAGTLQPLKNVTVKAGDVSGMTDGDGNATLQGARLGQTKLQVEKRGFSVAEQYVTLGWGSNPLGEVKARAVGSQYTFEAKDFLSNKPIAGAEATSGDGNASADDEGKLVLTLDTATLDDSAQVTVSISAAGYRTENITLSVGNKEVQAVEMVPSRKHVFVSKRSGKYDVYTIDADGKNEKKIVEGSGLEREDITLVPHPTENKAALVSTRERVQNAEGYLLSTAYVVDFESGDLVKIDQSEQVQIIGWSADSRLVYVKIQSGKSAADAKRHRLMSYNSRNYADVKELAAANSFNDVLMAGGRIYYAPSNIFNENPNPALYAVNPDGSNAQTILNKEAYNMFRTSYETLDISVGASWYSYSIGAAGGATASQAPVSQYSRVYADAPDGTSSLWVDTRDGKGVLLRYDKTAKADTTMLSRSGLKVPVYWLSATHIVFRLNDGKETADYVMSVDGGEPRKVSDVSDTNGVDRWYYY